jgi:hypothetical protein
MTTLDTPNVMGESTIFVEYQTVRRMIGGDLKRETTAA